MVNITASRALNDVEPKPRVLQIPPVLLQILERQRERGEFTTDEVDDQELGVLALRLLQICLVYVNTLFIQEVLDEDRARHG